MNDPITIPKFPVAETDSLNYAALRKQGVDYIIALGSNFWTDFNIHDPGITLLEALCFALTDLAYRTNFSTVDLLSPPPGTLANPDRQGFFTARNILTVNPWTVADFRKLLIDVVGVKNAWFFCRCCPCEMFLYVDCAKSQLGYDKTEHAITVNGIDDVLLEFDEEPVGDLNSGKVKQNFTFPTGPGTTATALIEMRLPNWHAIQQDLAKFKKFRMPDSVVTGVAVQFISGDRNDNVDIPASELARALRRPLYATIKIKFKPDKNQAGTATLSLDDVPLSVWFKSNADRQALQLADLKAAIEDGSASGIAARYLDVLHRADQVVADATQELQSHRNLCEDFCAIDAIEVSDVGLCLDLHVRPDADIEKVLAEAYYQISEYFAPSIRFYSLPERLAAGKTPDEIFEGPPLANGFIDDDQLAETQLKSTLYASDVINILMEIDGVIAVEKFTFCHFTDDGVLDAVYPWSIDIPDRHQPRLYLEASKILVFKNGLPFLPDRSELSDTLQMIRGENQPAALTAKDIDLPVPTGAYYDLTDYYPVQYSLPQTYGVGLAGLPQTASLERRGQARQLKGYLFFFEQLLVNYLYQLKNLSELFAIDGTVTHTYFTKRIEPDVIRDIDTELYTGLTQPILEALVENQTQWLDRRNRFLDHLLARFAEQFSDYALMLYSFETNKGIADADLINDKIALLKDYPFISANRARSFNYKDPSHVCSNDNIAGLKRRIELLLGFDPNQKIFIVEHVLLRPRNKPGGAFPTGDPLLPICVPPNCDLCGEEDPYSYRFTVVLNGDTGRVNTHSAFRRFAEQTIRLETPAHLALKVCWVSSAQLADFEKGYCAWLAELAKPEPDATTLHDRLVDLMKVFSKLKNVYPPATLHDCFEGSEDNEVYLGQTVI